MTYSEIFILGWNLNALMFIVNLILAFNVIRSSDPIQLSKENEKLSALKQEIDIYYPNRIIETIGSYLIPFTAFYRVSFRLVQMSSFFKRNPGTTMYDFMVYKYEEDIKKAKN